jgi:GDSL-like Lipase/Acylhydrolase family
MRKSFFRRPPFVVATATVALFFACDFGLGLLLLNGNPYAPNRYYHHALKPNLSSKARWGFAHYPITTNSLAMRIADRPAAPAGNVKWRILFLGDSFTEGVGVPYEQTFVGIIGRRLRQAGTGIEVFDGAVASHSPLLYLLHLQDLIERHGARFDEVVVFVDVSDIQDELVYEGFKPGRFTLSYVLRRAKEFLVQNSLIAHTLFYDAPALQPVFHALRSWVRGRSQPTADTKDFYAIRDAWLDNDEAFRSWGARGFALARKNLERLAAYAKSKGVVVSFAIYPWPRLVRHPNNRGQLVWEKIAAEDHWTLVDFYPDFAALPDPERLYIKGDVHWNAAGHRFVADAWIAHYCELRRAEWCHRPVASSAQ